MYVLYVDSSSELSEKTKLFRQYIEPLQEKLAVLVNEEKLPLNVPEFKDCVELCRMHFRQLEYAFALDALLNHIQPGSRYVDVGCGVAPFAHAIAMLPGVQVDACDSDPREIKALQKLNTEKIYGSKVNYSIQNTTAMNFPDETFDAISCISVLEHIPAPYDQAAVRELIRILKPGGVLVATVDFVPMDAVGWSYYVHRFGQLLRSGDITGIIRSFSRKVKAQQAVAHGEASHARSANQSYQPGHLAQDIAPLVSGKVSTSRLNFSTDLDRFTSNHTKKFWQLDPHAYQTLEKRDVLPAGFLFDKPL